MCLFTCCEVESEDDYDDQYEVCGEIQDMFITQDYYGYNSYHVVVQGQTRTIEYYDWLNSFVGKNVCVGD